MSEIEKLEIEAFKSLEELKKLTHYAIPPHLINKFFMQEGLYPYYMMWMAGANHVLTKIEESTDGK